METEEWDELLGKIPYDAAAPNSKSFGPSKEGGVINLADKTIEQLVKTYILAEKLVDRKSANKIRGKLIEVSERLNSVGAIELGDLIYTNTTATSNLRRLYVDWHIHDMIVCDGEMPMCEHNSTFLAVLFFENQRLSFLGRAMQTTTFILQRTSDRPDDYHLYLDETTGPPPTEALRKKLYARLRPQAGPLPGFIPAVV